MSRLSGIYHEVAWNPDSIVAGNDTQVDVTVPGAQLGDFVLASFDKDLLDLQLNGSVTAVNTVTCTLSNSTGATRDVASGTLRIKVVPFDVI